MSSQSSTKSEGSRDALASLRINREAETKRRSGKRWWKVVLLLIVLGVGGWFAYAWVDSAGLLQGQSQWVPEIMQNRVEVRLASVTVQKGRSADAVVVATGYLESRRQARIGARAAGRINMIFFEEGDRVSKGEILAELDHKDLDASLAAADASVARAKSALGRAGDRDRAGIGRQGSRPKNYGSREVSRNQNMTRPGSLSDGRRPQRFDGGRNHAGGGSKATSRTTQGEHVHPCALLTGP